MSVLAQGIHTHTPRLTVSDPRGLAVRTVDYCRSAEGTEPEERVNRSAYDAMGRLVEQWDPRLWALSTEDAAAPPNLTNRYSLSGKVLGSLSVDAGERVSLFGDGDQLLQAWDSRGSERRVEYDDLLRPLALFEQGEGEAPRCTERYEYADASADFAAHNQCGQLMRHDDPAGTLTMDEYALTGGVLEQTQRFLSALEMPDWPQALSARDALLEPVAQAATSSTHFNPLGDVLEQTDAKGNRQQFDYTFDGQLFATHLQLSAQTTATTLVSNIHYNAYGQVEQETAGNGVVSTLTYRPEDGRLTRLQARHGTEAALQDLRYEYDPVGNVLSIEDSALPIRYFANQRVEPKKQYDYDSLYQLIKATGWEAGGASRGPVFNRFDDPSAVANYQQTCRYDAGGNLLELVHVGPQSHSRKLTAARYSNRCLPEQNDRPPTEEEIAAAFDGNGNLLQLQQGQAMSWDLRNQLREVRPVERENADDDLELYVYDGGGQRRRKVRTTQTNARALLSEVRYLPGLELRTREGTGEVLQVICVLAGRSAMQVLHWETTPPSGITNDQYRYNLTDHLGSSSLELDDEAAVISQETYHPYGSTAWFAGRSEVEASYKTVHYSGKERDATGLYYYGFRYYACWLQRWINPDPAGDVDGLNRFTMVANNPISNVDRHGLVGEGWERARNAIRTKLFPETRPKPLIHPMLGSRRLTHTVAENLSDPTRAQPTSRKFQGVQYFDAEQREKYAVTVKNGLIYSSGEAGKPLTSSARKRFSDGYVGIQETPQTTTGLNWKNSQMVYVLGWEHEASYDDEGKARYNKQLLIFPYERNVTHHSSGFAGGRVLDSGLITLYEGNVVYIENKSGHYWPYMEQKHHTLDFLDKAGVDLSRTFISNEVRPDPEVNGFDLGSVVFHKANEYHEKRGEELFFSAPVYEPDDSELFARKTQQFWF
ncbi:RHS repeat-associated core domain-containing protein [Pseudomonas gingeri]|uniref:RHS repeat-associated core domain-containing protein n=1 Tax=Pseudomonas gingeri TaxID=117681 RepID=UPI00210953BD|nr:RHS repeat-associated core domain-containing protein [Pseudomonas gingeri]